jgi:hypothetical protein
LLLTRSLISMSSRVMSLMEMGLIVMFVVSSLLSMLAMLLNGRIEQEIRAGRRGSYSAAC